LLFDAAADKATATPKEALVRDDGAGGDFHLAPQPEFVTEIMLSPDLSLVSRRKQIASATTGTLP